MTGTLFDAPDFADGWATLSDDARYRYVLGRRWGDPAQPVGSGRRLLWVMLNPSTADAELDDRTVTTCTEVSRRAGYDELTIVNLFAYRATDPKDLIAAAKDGVDVVGPGNLAAVLDEAAKAHAIAVAWGANVDNLARRPHRRWAPAWDMRRTVADVAARRELAVYSLGLTAGGHPRHPCRLGYGVPLVPYTGAA